MTLFVRDNGIGIDPHHGERVFELFDRLDPSGEGTGVGLALARRIVETHGGRIWLESAGRPRLDVLFHAPAGRPAPQRGDVRAVSRAVSHSSKPARLATRSPRPAVGRRNP